jgi:hypothetical protein
MDAHFHDGDLLNLPPSVEVINVSAYYNPASHSECVTAPRLSI